MISGKKKYLKLLLIFSFVLTGVLTGCSGTYDDMIEDYNKKYFSREPTESNNPSISDENFFAEKMLEKRYTFVKGYESSLAAPSGGAAYNWTIKVPETRGSEKIVEKSVCSTQIYNFLPERDFKTDSEATLVLTVTDSSGTEYKDTALIIVISRN